MLLVTNVLLVTIGAGCGHDPRDRSQRGCAPARQGMPWSASAFEQAHAGTRGPRGRPPPLATPRYVDLTRSAFMQVRCAVVALWSEHEEAYATWIRPATTKLDSFLPSSRPQLR